MSPCLVTAGDTGTAGTSPCSSGFMLPALWMGTAGGLGAAGDICHCGHHSVGTHGAQWGHSTQPLPRILPEPSKEKVLPRVTNELLISVWQG